VQTLEQVIDLCGVDVDAHLERDMEILVSGGMQRQGDVIVVPVNADAPVANPVPPQGFPVVLGENGGNTHLLLPQGVGVFYSALPPQFGKLDLGLLHVAKGSVAYLAHPEHGYAGIAPGSYTIRRQREQADIVRLVQD
jgi:hypothetical protein